MCHDKTLLSNIKETNVSITAAMGFEKTATQKGEVQVNGLHLRDVLYVPTLMRNLISVAVLVKDGWKITFGGTEDCVVSKGNQVIFQ